MCPLTCQNTTFSFFTVFYTFSLFTLLLLLLLRLLSLLLKGAKPYFYFEVSNNCVLIKHNLKVNALLKATVSPG